MSNGQKLGRNYSLTISGDKFASPLVVALPFTIEFDITRNTLTSANVCQIRLYNLSKNNRELLRRNATGYGYPFEPVVLKAGYGNENLPIIFSGNVSQAWSVREGVNFITTIECYDGGFAFVNAETNLTVPSGTPNQIVIGNLIKSLPNVTLGAVGNYPGSTTKKNTYTGSTLDNLKQLTGGGFFIDGGVGNALGDAEYSTANPPLQVDASVGLLGSPILEQTTVRFNMIFEPFLVAGCAANLQSFTDQNFNGIYKVTSVKHRGTISATVCGDAITTGEFFFLKSPTPVVSSG